MKNIIKNTLIVGASVAMLATGCIKESIQSSTVTKADIANSANGTAAMMNGIPGFINTINLFGRSNPYGYDWGYPSIGMIRDFLCSDMAAASGSYEWFTAWFTNQAMGDSYVYSQFIWNYYTQFLYTANDLIGILGKAETAAEEVRHYAGIAYAFRAMIWLDMARMYEFKSNTVYDMPELEGLTIPLINELLTEETAVNNPRLPKEEIISYIKEDIDTALELLEGFVSEDRSLPTKAFVYGLRARTLLWEGDYDNAKIAAQDALNAGSFAPLTEAQWTDPKTGFNSVETQSSWILCSRLTSDSAAVKGGSGLFNFTSWMSSETTFGYISLDCLRCCDAKFYSQIPDTDWRKKSWKAPAGSTLVVPMNPAKGAYPGPSVLNELANVKFRPGNGEPNDPLVAAACDYPLMRMEEMKFIIAECDARKGSAASLIDIVKTRNPQYTTSLTGDSLVREVLFQKRIEFWGEGILFFDYKRCPEYLNIERGYPGTNHQADARFNVKGLAPWFNICIVKTETMSNTAIVNNPDPSDKVELWSEN